MTEFHRQVGDVSYEVLNGEFKDLSTGYALELRVLSEGHGILNGKWISWNRPEFIGKIQRKNNVDRSLKGFLAFPDDKKVFSFEYFDTENKMYLEGRFSGVEWVKGSEHLHPQYSPGENDDFEELSNADIAGVYPAAVIKVVGKEILGKWTSNGRPDFSGVFNGDNIGSVSFPDDQTYTFEYDKHEKTIYWNSRDSGNKWKKVGDQEAKHDPLAEIDGVYPSAIIKLEGTSILGQWKTKGRPNFFGHVIGKNIGFVEFPDDRKYRFEYDPEHKIIFWDYRNSGNTWKKEDN
jgi:hypothetical protein